MAQCSEERTTSSVPPLTSQRASPRKQRPGSCWRRSRWLVLQSHRESLPRNWGQCACDRSLTACRSIPLNWRPCQTPSGYAPFARCTRLSWHTAGPRLPDHGFVLLAAPTHIGDPQRHTPGRSNHSRFASPNRSLARGTAVSRTRLPVERPLSRSFPHDCYWTSQHLVDMR